MHCDTCGQPAEYILYDLHDRASSPSHWCVTCITGFFTQSAGNTLLALAQAMAIESKPTALRPVP